MHLITEGRKGKTKPAAERYAETDRLAASQLDSFLEFSSLPRFRFANDRPVEGDAQPCHSIERDDNSASAVVFLSSGLYHDSGSADGYGVYIWEVAARLGQFGGDWKAAKAHYYAKAGVELPTSKNRKAAKKVQDDPYIVLQPEPWNQGATTFVRQWGRIHKKCLTLPAIKLVGGFYSRYPYGRVDDDGKPIPPNDWVIAFPVFEPGSITKMIGAIVYRKNGLSFEFPPTKVLNVGLVQGFVGKHGLELLAGGGEIDCVYVCEGSTDTAALQGIIPESHINRIAVIGVAGAKQMSAEAAKVLAGHRVVIVGDADKPGVAGAKKRGKIALAAGAKEVALLIAAYAIEEKHGKDIRDEIGDGLTFEGLQAHPTEKLTTAAADEPDEPDQFSNARTIEDEEGNKKHKPKSLAEIDVDLRALTNGEPKRTGKLLFVQDGNRGVVFLNSPPALLSFIGRKTGKPIPWVRGNDFVTKEEFFADQSANAPNFETVETIPHFPPRPNTFYTYSQAPGDGSALRQLLERFNFETEIDRDLFVAFIATLFWGGPPGSRPAFGFTSRDGRGAGKTSLVKMASLLVGGFLDVAQSEDAEKVKTRLLSDNGRGYRGALLDNLKSHRYSCGWLEGLITSPWISGKDLYRGEGCRPNLLTWAITLNGASLSKDMAQRTVFIHVRRPSRSGNWEESTTKFILDNRDALIADVAGFFQEPAEPLSHFTRWAVWESEILARLPEPTDAQRVIEERQGDSDVDTEEAVSVEDYFAEQLHALGYDVTADAVHIPTAIGAKWLSTALGEPRTPVSATRIVKQQHDERTLKQLGVNPCRSNGRGLLWKPEQADEIVHYDLLDRLEHQRKTQLRSDSKIRTEGARSASSL